MKGDLHVHTTLSDGSLGVEDVIAQAKRIGLDFISITDHDTMSSISRAKVLGDRYGIQTIPGVELTAWDKTRGRKVHILCYAPQKPDRLEGICRRCSEIRQSCAKETVENVLKLYPITAEDITKHVVGSKASISSISFMRLSSTAIPTTSTESWTMSFSTKNGFLYS